MDAGDGFVREASGLFEDLGPSKRAQRLVGLEYELLVVDDRLRPNPEAVSSFLGRGLDGYGTEQHTDTLEVRTDPYPVGSFDELASQLRSRVEAFLAAEPEASVLGLGAQPTKRYEDIELTPSGRYRAVVEALPGLRTELEGLTAGIHLNLQATDDGDLMDAFNHAVMLEPYVVALAANSSALLGADSGAAEARLPLIEGCLGLPWRSGLPRYCRDLEDYLAEAYTWGPVPVAGAGGLDGRLSTDWHEVRVRVGADRSLRCELRAIPQQPTMEESLACVAFYLGLVERHRGAPLLDHALVEANREEAIRYGLGGELYDPEGRLRPAKEVVAEALDEAAEGLAAMGIDEAYLEPLRDRVRRGGSPGELLAQDARTLSGALAPRDALEEAVRRRLQGSHGRLAAYVAA